MIMWLITFLARIHGLKIKLVIDTWMARIWKDRADICPQPSISSLSALIQNRQQWWFNQTKKIIFSEFKLSRKQLETNAI